MLDVMKTCVVLLKDRRGVTAVEYAVIAGVLVAAIGAAFTALGSTLKTYFQSFNFS